jgi:hypothetical protein
MRPPARSESVHDDLKDRPQRVTGRPVTSLVLGALFKLWASAKLPGIHL